MTWTDGEPRDDSATADPLAATPGDARHTVTAGTWVEHYEIIRPLGQGGMGRVFLARDTKLARRVAIKFVSSKSPERFLREAQVTAQCHHENIVVIHDIGSIGDQSYLVLEHVEGEPLTQLIAGRRLTPTRAVELAVPIAAALEHAHQVGIIHRDLKPQNVLVTRRGTVKVLDFGIAKLMSDEPSPQDEAPAHASVCSSLTPAGSFVGSLPYMAPEQWGYGVVDHRVDVWALGVMLYEMLAGKRPFAGNDAAEFRAKLAPEILAPSVAEVCPHLPVGVVRIVDRCLRKAKEERYASARELLEDLGALVAGRRRSLREGECPYPGLLAFRESDAEHFYGRAADIARLVSRIRDQPLSVVAGHSGVGKSSLVFAGAIPALKESGEPWHVFPLRPGRRPLVALARVVAALARRGDGPGNNGESRGIERRLRHEPGFVGTVLRRYAAARKSLILLYVDQLEELYTLGADESEKRAFTACLAGAADDCAAPVRVVLSMRSDFLDRVAEDTRFAEMITEGLLFLKSLDREGLTEALTEPLRQAGYEFESADMVSDLVATVDGASGSLPILQFTAVRLWEQRDQERKIVTRASYDLAGGVAGTLARHADDVVQALSAAARDVARGLFVRLVTAEQTRALVDRDELEELGQHRAETARVIDQLVRARLLVSHPAADGASATVELIHESLIASWPTLRRWLDESHKDGLFRAQLHAIARQWLAIGCPDGLLWRGDSAEEARRWRRRYREPVSDGETRYLAAVSDLATRASRRRRRVVTGVILTLVTAVLGSIIALVAIGRAERAATHQAERVQREATRARRAEEAAVAREREARTATARAERASTLVEASRAELKQALKEAEAQRRVAETESARARAAALQARASEENAKSLAASERKARQDLEQALERERQRLAAERARNLRLERERQRIATELQ